MKAFENRENQLAQGCLFPDNPCYPDVFGAILLLGGFIGSQKETNNLEGSYFEKSPD